MRPRSGYGVICARVMQLTEGEVERAGGGDDGPALGVTGHRHRHRTLELARDRGLCLSH